MQSRLSAMGRQDIEVTMVAEGAGRLGKNSASFIPRAILFWRRKCVLVSSEVTWGRVWSYFSYLLYFRRDSPISPGGSVVWNGLLSSFRRLLCLLNFARSFFELCFLNLYLFSKLLPKLCRPACILFYLVKKPFSLVFQNDVSKMEGYFLRLFLYFSLPLGPWFLHWVGHSMTWRAFKNKNKEVWAYGHILYLKYSAADLAQYHLSEHEALTLGKENGVRRVSCGEKCLQMWPWGWVKAILLLSLPPWKNIIVNPPHSVTGALIACL